MVAAKPLPFKFCLLVPVLMLMAVGTCAWPGNRNRRLKENRKNITLESVATEPEGGDDGQCFVELEFIPYDKFANQEQDPQDQQGAFSTLSYVGFSIAGIAVSALSLRLIQRGGPAKSAIGSDVCFDDDESMGGLDDTDVVFDGIKLILTQPAKKKGKDGVQPPAHRYLLDGSFRGRAYAGRMMAIMGPSGTACRSAALCPCMFAAYFANQPLRRRLPHFYSRCRKGKPCLKAPLLVVSQKRQY